MIFALGFLAAGLIILMLLPAVWGRAVRLSLRRLERHLPLSMAEVVAERDRLRAESAVVQRRLEQKLEHVSRQRALDFGELGRRARQITVLEADLAETRTTASGLAASLSEVGATLTATEAELGAVSKEFYDTSGLLERTRLALDELTEDHRRLGELADQRRFTIAALQTTVEAGQAKSEDIDRKLRESDEVIQRRLHDLEVVSTAQESARTEISLMQARHAMLEARITSQTAQIAEMEAARATVDADRANHLATISKRDETIAALLARVADLEDKLIRAAQEAREAERQTLQRIELLRAEKAALEGALEVARRDRDALLQEQKAAQSLALDTARRDDGVPAATTLSAAMKDADLQSTILEIAAEVRRLAGSMDTSAPQAKSADVRVRRERLAAREARDGVRGSAPGAAEFAAGPPSQAARTSK
ncbi:MAG: hypothetical protein JO273_08750 [Methylobacteriaceae bacterium]|nr:hypothetical protein [Methylobacteriaceae bacterium]